MKKVMIAGLVCAGLLTTLSSCHSGKHCRGGGWYGPRNLEVTTDCSENFSNSTAAAIITAPQQSSSFVQP